MSLPVGWRRPAWRATHAALALSLALSAGLLWELRQTRQALRHEVEQGVSAGIQDGVGAALDPAGVQASSAAATRGVVEGLVGSALGDAEAPRATLARGTRALGDASQDLLEGALGVPAPPPQAAQPSVGASGLMEGHSDGLAEGRGDGPAGGRPAAAEGRPVPAAEGRPSRARRAGELVGDAVDLGLGVAEALLGGPRRPGPSGDARDEGARDPD